MMRTRSMYISTRQRQENHNSTCLNLNKIHARNQFLEKQKRLRFGNIWKNGEDGMRETRAWSV